MPKSNILIVEDEHIVAMDIQRYLERNDYQVAGHADRGEDAVKKAGELAPDLILMDISLKGEMDGIEAATQIQARGSLPIIFLTAFSNQSVLDRARLIGPHGYILKPFEERELIVAIEMALYKHGMEQKLRESENKFRSVIEHASDGIVLADNRGNIIEWNPAMEQITGLKQSEVMGLQSAEVIFRLAPKEQKVIELRDANAEQWNQSVNSGYANVRHLAENEIETPQGILRIIQSNEFAVETPQGVMAGVIIRDVTEHKRAEENLRESQLLYHSLVESSPLSVCRKDMEGRFTFANQRFLELSQIALTDLVGKDDFDLHPPELAEKYRRDDQAVLNSGQVYELIEDRATNGGELAVVQTVKAPVYDGTGKTSGIQISFWDITARKRAEEALRAAEEDYRAIFEKAPVGIFRSTPDGRFQKINHVMAEMYGYVSPEEMAVDIKSISKQIYAEPLLRDEFTRQLAEHGEVINFESLDRRRDGSTFWTSMNARAVKNADGEILYYEGFVTDVTERKQTELQLRKLSQAVEQSANSIIITDVEGRIEYANPKFSEISGYSLPEALGQNPRILRSYEHPREFYQHLWNTIKSGKTWRGELRNKRKDGALYWEDTSIAPVYDAAGKMINFIAVKEDITLRKSLEESERDQHRLAEALRDTAMALNSTLKLDDILERILGNIGKLVSYDMAMVSLLEDDVVQKTRYHNNPHNTNTRLPIGDLQTNLVTVPILKTIIKTKQPQLIPDIQKDARWETVAIPGMNRIRSLVCAPIEIQGNVAGIINVVSGLPDLFTALHAERIMAFASQAAVAIENAQLYEQAKRLSFTDPLTELFNMRYFLDFARLEFDRIRRYERTASVVMLDIDHFKNINDVHGHGVGDWVLHEIAARIKNAVRAVDVVARYGGEEFIVLMPETKFEEAYQIAERIRQSIAGSPIENDGAVILATLSAGVAEVDDDAKKLEELIKYADQALYKAKANGRNRIENYAPTKG